jgi:hypothetical protein
MTHGNASLGRPQPSTQSGADALLWFNSDETANGYKMR